MLKVMLLIKRKPGMSMEEFIDYYENVHAVGDKSGTGIRHYERHYLRPAPYFIGGHVAEAEYDVLTEIWFDDRAAFDAVLTTAAGNPDWVATVAADEENFMDRPRCRAAFVESRDTDLGA